MDAPSCCRKKPYKEQPWEAFREMGAPFCCRSLTRSNRGKRSAKRSAKWMPPFAVEALQGTTVGSIPRSVPRNGCPFCFRSLTSSDRGRRSAASSFVKKSASDFLRHVMYGKNSLFFCFLRLRASTFFLSMGHAHPLSETMSWTEQRRAIDPPSRAPFVQKN